MLLISCANVANLMTAQATAREREMALRVSIGAGRWRLVQLVIPEYAWLAFLAAGVAACFAWWVAPRIVGMIGNPDDPARLVLPADWRVLGFGVAMALGVTLLFGLAPALRASGVKPLRGAEGRRTARDRAKVMQDALTVVLLGSLAGTVVGIASARFIEALLFDVKATDAGILAFPAAAIFAVALLAALPAVIRAVRTDPARMLRPE